MPRLNFIGIPTFNLLTSSALRSPSQIEHAGTVMARNKDPPALRGGPLCQHFLLAHRSHLGPLGPSARNHLLALAVRLVLRLVHEREELRVLVGLDLGEPAVLLGRLVQERRLVAERLVDLDNLARQRGVDVRRGLDRLDGADGLWLSASEQRAERAVRERGIGEGGSKKGR